MIYKKQNTVQNYSFKEINYSSTKHHRPNCDFCDFPPKPDCNPHFPPNCNFNCPFCGFSPCQNFPNNNCDFVCYNNSCNNFCPPTSPNFPLCQPNYSLSGYVFNLPFCCSINCNNHYKNNCQPNNCCPQQNICQNPNFWWRLSFCITKPNCHKDK